jgi:hypothetical protein
VQDVVATTAQGGIAGNNPTKIAMPYAFTRNFDPTVQEQRFGGLSGDYVLDTPTYNADRQLELRELAHPSVEPASIAGVSGVSVVVSRRTQDLESL